MKSPDKVIQVLEGIAVAGIAICVGIILMTLGGFVERIDYNVCVGQKVELLDAITDTEVELINNQCQALTGYEPEEE